MKAIECPYCNPSITNVSRLVHALTVISAARQRPTPALQYLEYAEA